MIIPGTIKDQPHAVFTKIPAIRDPKMFPTDVWEFQIPIIRPRLIRKVIKVRQATIKVINLRQHLFYKYFDLNLIYPYKYQLG